MAAVPVLFRPTPCVTGSRCSSVACWRRLPHAFDTTTAFTAKSLYVTSKLTSTPFENKWLRDARGDAASFVASDGSIRGARLKRRCAGCVSRTPSWRPADQELAEAILAQ
ncbi:DUF2388 domain-containing protein [Pseudomonas aeruginosa]